MNARGRFLERRLRVRERELGLAMRACFERREHPPAELREEHRVVWDQLRQLRSDSGGVS
jgi:hypothetical protein